MSTITIRRSRPRRARPTWSLLATETPTRSRGWQRSIGERSTHTAIGCSVRCRTRRTRCRRRCSPCGAASPHSRAVARCARGCIASPPTPASGWAQHRPHRWLSSDRTPAWSDVHDLGEFVENDPTWVEPYPGPTGDDPADRYQRRENVGARLRRRAAAVAGQPTRRARPARRAAVLGDRGRRGARHDRGVGEQRAPQRAHQSVDRRIIAGTQDDELRRLGIDGQQRTGCHVRCRVGAGRRARAARPADRGCALHDAAVPGVVPRPRCASDASCRNAPPCSSGACGRSRPTGSSPPRSTSASRAAARSR